MVPAFERRLPDQQQQMEMEGEGEVTLPAVCEGVRAGSVTPFHIRHFPAGHNPTDYERCAPYPMIAIYSPRSDYSQHPSPFSCRCRCRRWMAVSAGGDRDIADNLGTYQVHYAEYYEPYVIMAAVRLTGNLGSTHIFQTSMYVCMYVCRPALCRWTSASAGTA